MKDETPLTKKHRSNNKSLPIAESAPSHLERTSIFLFHKPKGFLVTRKDEKERKTVYHALPPFVLLEGWVPIGRLDKDSRGLLLFTQDGSVVDRITEPGQCEKIYEVEIRGRISDDDLSHTLQGVPTSIGTLKIHKITKTREVGPKTQLEVVLREGKNRHLRRLFHALKDPKFHTPLKVLDLKRVQIGPLRLDIPVGEWRFATRDEETQLFAAVNMPVPKDCKPG
ncbi:MAG: pseudouridine synthase [Nitrospirota bacterium]|nr:pseudouridine synthase [Nitrospirota bacterium]